MRIACIIHSLDGGGAERVIASLASRLFARDHQVTLITLDDGSVERHAVDPGVDRQRLKVMGESRGALARLFRTSRRVRVVRQAIVRSNCDVVLSFCDRTNILVLMAARPLSVPVVVAERSDPSQQHLGMLREALRDRTYPHAAAIIALTDTSADHLRSRFSNDVVVIPSAVDSPPLRADRRAAEANRRILAAGRLEHEKGFDRLLAAFAAVANEAPGWSLRILGEGSQRAQLEQRIDELSLGDRVRLPGWISPIWEELAAATIFALPSRYEGFPSALLEAMAMGVPCVAVDCQSGPRAILDDPAAGLLVGNDVEALAEGLAKLIRDPELRERLGRTATNVVGRFGWDAMVDAYERVLDRVIHDNKPRG